MLTVEDYGRIRRAHRDGLSIRAIAKRFHHSRRKVREALQSAEPRRYTRQKLPFSPKLEPFKPIIDQILEEDEQAPPKQRHTAAQIFRRLQSEHGYAGGYDQVRRYVASHVRQRRETFIPLEHAPGQRVECDFGHIWVDFPAGRRQVPVLLVTWAYSYCPFAMALPSERTEAILHGLVEAFAFFGCVPRELWWDNPKTVAVAILRGRQRRLNERYVALASHYNFEPLFCMPARGNEKPHVENRVKNLQRRWATPVPQVADLNALNAYLRRCCEEDRQRTVGGQSETIGRRFEAERQAALPLPIQSFDAGLREAREVDKYQTVAFDNNRYSVPRQWAFQTMTVKGYVDRVEVVAQGQVIARHQRAYETGQQILDPRHYLATLSRKPACLDHAPVFRDWKLPLVFEQLRRELEERHGGLAGSRQFVRVLQLLATHSVEQIGGAIETTLVREGPQTELILARVEHLRQRASSAEVPSPEIPPLAIPPLHVPRPDLSQFDRFLSSGDLEHVPEPSEPLPALENQLEAVAAAGDACGV
jgi:transposase